MKCQKCGNEINDNDKFCSKCGAGINNETTNKKKDLNYYHKRLINDNKFLLAVTIFFMIINIATSVGFSGKMGPYKDIAADVFIKSLLFLVFEIIILKNKNTPNKAIVILAIIAGAIMVVWGKVGPSMFDLVYFLLGIIYVIHSIIFLVKYDKLENGLTTQSLKIDMKDSSKLKYLTLLPIPIFVIIGLVCFRLIKSCMHDVVFWISIIVISIINIIFCHYINKKGKKSILVYVMLVFSIISVFFGLVMFGSDGPYCLNYGYKDYLDKEKRLNSKEYKLCNEIENVYYTIDDVYSLDEVVEDYTTIYDEYCTNKDSYVCKKVKQIIEESKDTKTFEDCSKFTGTDNLNCTRRNEEKLRDKEDKIVRTEDDIDNKCDSKYGDLDNYEIYKNANGT